MLSRCHVPAQTDQKVGGGSDGHLSPSDLFGDLNLPYIDASLPPSPRPGRASISLAILTGELTESQTDMISE